VFRSTADTAPYRELTSFWPRLWRRIQADGPVRTRFCQGCFAPKPLDRRREAFCSEECERDYTDRMAW
jgi:hypothetical protein